MKVTLISLCVLVLVPWSATATVIEYGDVTLIGGFQSGNFPELWDLTLGPLELQVTYDATGLEDDLGGDAHAWTEIGVRALGYGNFNPTWMVGGAGVWLATDYDWSPNTFDPDPTGAPILDLDDKLILQRGGGLGEGSYDLPAPPPNPWANHAVWFDRDGVDQWQAAMWGAIDGVTYNTVGTYDILIELQATSATSGYAYMSVYGEPQGFYVPGWHSGPADLMPAGMAWTGDMKFMQVFYGIYGYGATHSVVLNDITVKGFLTTQVDIDVKPGCWPDPFNVSSRGVLPVAVLGSAEVDVSNIDTPTLKLEGVAPLRWDIKDVTSDGFDDLNLKFDTQEMVDALKAKERPLNDGDVETLMLKAQLVDETAIWGSDDVTIINPKGGPAAAGASSVLKTFVLYQNTPNPFRKRTTICFELRSRGSVRLDILDASGRLVETHVDEELNAGPRSCEWDAASLASGVYFYRLSSGGHSLTGKMLVAR